MKRSSAHSPRRLGCWTFGPWGIVVRLLCRRGAIAAVLAGEQQVPHRAVARFGVTNFVCELRAIKNATRKMGPRSIT